MLTLVPPTVRFKWYYRSYVHVTMRLMAGIYCKLRVTGYFLAYIGYISAKHMTPPPPMFHPFSWHRTRKTFDIGLQTKRTAQPQ